MDIVTTCDTNYTCGRGCRKSFNRGKMCDAFKHKWKVQRPYEILDRKEPWKKYYIK